AEDGIRVLTVTGVQTCALPISRIVRDIGGGAAHVEADDAIEPGRRRGAHRAHDAPGRPRQDRVLALEAVRVRQPAVRLHEQQPRSEERRVGKEGSTLMSTSTTI